MLRANQLAPLSLAGAVLVGMLAGCTTTSTTATSSPASTPVAPLGHVGCAAATPGTTCVLRLLVFTKTQAFRHASIPAARAAVALLARQRGWRVDFTEDAAQFTSATLARYDAVLFLLTTGNVLGAAQKAAFEQYIRSGGGFAGVHSASDTEYSWAWYDGLVGAHNNVNNKHSSVVQGTINVVDPTHSSTSMLPARWTRTDEWYNFASNPRPRVHVLMTMDETTYRGGTMGADHPIAWYHAYDGGRAWFTALGHTTESYSEPLFLAHLGGGIAYALGVSGGMAATPGSGTSPAACAGQASQAACAGQASQAACAGQASQANQAVQTALIAPAYCGGMPDAAHRDATESARTAQARRGTMR
jgi:type 1 glutamine amidotransferase